MHRPAVVLVLFGIALLACPPAEKQQKAPGPCTKLGDTCEVAPGKLGTCVVNDGCTTGSVCFVCQSQH